MTEGALEWAGEIPTRFGETVLGVPALGPGPPRHMAGAHRGPLRERGYPYLREMVDQFLAKTGGALTVMEGGEHWFHTPEQMKVLEVWERANL